jgi:hypothetical protein
VALILLDETLTGVTERQMSSNWQFEGNAMPTFAEVEAMAAVLEGRHGALAADVAEFFATLHDLKGNAARSHAWAGVAERARERAAARARDI